jgi:Cdc6-like AAA superfamily ATPase
MTDRGGVGNLVRGWRVELGIYARVPVIAPFFRTASPNRERRPHFRLRYACYFVKMRALDKGFERSARAGAMAEIDWEALKSEVYGAFSPGAPIKLQEDLAGREEQASRLRNIVMSAGEHALIYGERGVGKTSISNTFYSSINSPTKRVRAIHVNCGTSDFATIWRKVFRRISGPAGSGARTLDELYPNDITPDDVEVEFSNFDLNELPIVVLDEFDKIPDEATKLLMTDTIKSFSDHAIHAKLVLVGIAENAEELLEHHGSISRALKQIKMPRLDLQDLEQVVSVRYKRCGLKIDDEALFQIAFLSRGLPYYSHLVGRHSALSALSAERIIIRDDDVYQGLAEAMKEVDQTITKEYLEAVVSQRDEVTLFEPVLIACALAEPDDLGQFQQAGVALPLAEISPRTPPYTAATFAFHMNEFCEEKRGCVLQRSGEARNYRYSFTDAMMQPYVIMRALQNNKLSRLTFEKFVTRRQRSLAI